MPAHWHNADFIDCKPSAMEHHNPYAPPKANLTEVRASHCTRDGASVIIQRGSDLPQRCIICNAPAQLPIKKRKLYWHTPWIAVLILGNVLLYLIVALIIRKTFDVSPGMCALHQSKRKRKILGWVAAGIGTCAVGAVLLSQAQEGIAPIVLVVGCIFLVCAAFASRMVYAKKITAEYASVRGCKEPFLASLE